MLTVNKITYIDDYQFKVTLSNGLKGIFDVTQYLNKGIFTQLKNVNYLKQVKMNFAGIYWPDGQDFSADTIEYDIKNGQRTDNSLPPP